MTFSPATWDEEIYRGASWVKTFTLDANYAAADWLVRMRVGSRDPFVELTDGDGITATFDDGVTTVTMTISSDDTLALDPVTQGRWAIQSTLDGIIQPWFIGSIEVKTNAIEGA